LLLVGVAMAGPLACAWLQWHRVQSAEDDSATLALARLANWSLLAGTALGGVLLALRWWLDDRAYISALAMIPTSRLWSALAELLFSMACMAVYVALWNRYQKRVLHRVLAVAAGSNLMVHFPALFAIIAVLSTHARQPGHPLDRAEYQRMLLDVEIVSRVIHVWLAAFAVTGLTLMILGRRVARTRQRHAAGRILVARGALLGLVATLLQIPSGLLLVLHLPDSAREPLLGGDIASTGLFVLAILSALVLMHALAAIALGDEAPRQIRLATLTLILVMLLMVGTRARVQAHASHGADAFQATATNTSDISRGALRQAEVTLQ
jgi:hypothetical protein